MLIKKDKKMKIEMFGNYRGGFDSIVELREDDFGGCEIIYVIDGSVDVVEKSLEEVVEMGIEEGVWVKEDNRLVEVECIDDVDKWGKFIERYEKYSVKE